ncbi:hypothetical protein [Aquimarina sp. 2201CG14-23]|uniref:hypothetical protein n=1 Tax=Aquimarina mycalae TaxID=3040073 RepID=UPI002477DD28|nr:hypothetical protein [Aquimarina sp. 2201CG14-23]MDH7447182.1 hypothetical protein [Aquimarina sp. 2201CG14-23]
MKKVIVLIALCVSSMLTGQTNSNKNYFKLDFQCGLGFGFKNIDLFFDQNNDASTISGGGGWSLSIGGSYVLNNQFELGANIGYQFSQLRPRLTNVSTSFDRITILPTFKYLIALNANRDHSINIGTGYGFYLNGTIKFDAESIGLGEGDFKYENASGIHFLTEYEFRGGNRVGYVIGLKYYNVSYESKSQTTERDVNDFNGTGIDLYVGATIRL